MKKVEATAEQLAAARSAFKANKNLDKAFVSKDNQVFNDLNFCTAHSREIHSDEYAEINKADVKEEKEKK